jgi:hypothetical protein
MTSQTFNKPRFDLTGTKIGRWNVIKQTQRPDHIKKKVGSWWLCECECGTKKPVSRNTLSSGKSLSCGCLHKEIVAESTPKHKRTHGETGTRLYNIWAGMKSRCYDSNQLVYPNYGGRGIKVCDEWKNSYEAFRDWAYLSGYKNDLTIERIDVNGNYYPNNCTWITLEKQASNKRSNLKITAWGETKWIYDWLKDERCLIKNSSSLKTRLNRGMNPEAAMSKPKIKNPEVNKNGQPIV